jgi:hypothetical protein
VERHKFQGLFAVATACCRQAKVQRRSRGSGSENGFDAAIYVISFVCIAIQNRPKTQEKRPDVALARLRAAPLRGRVRGMKIGVRCVGGKWVGQTKGVATSGLLKHVHPRLRHVCHENGNNGSAGTVGTKGICCLVHAAKSFTVPTRE